MSIFLDDVFIAHINSNGTYSELIPEELPFELNPSNILLFFFPSVKHLYVWIGKTVKNNLRKFIAKVRKEIFEDHPEFRMLRSFTIDQGEEDSRFFSNLKISPEEFRKFLSLHDVKTAEIISEITDLRLERDKVYKRGNFESALEYTHKVLSLLEENHELLNEEYYSQIKEEETKILETLEVLKKNSEALTQDAQEKAKVLSDLLEELPPEEDIGNLNGDVIYKAYQLAQQIDLIYSKKLGLSLPSNLAPLVERARVLYENFLAVQKKIEKEITSLSREYYSLFNAQKYSEAREIIQKILEYVEKSVNLDLKIKWKQHLHELELEEQKVKEEERVEFLFSKLDSLLNTLSSLEIEKDIKEVDNDFLSHVESQLSEIEKELNRVQSDYGDFISTPPELSEKYQMLVETFSEKKKVLDGYKQSYVGYQEELNSLHDLIKELSSFTVSGEERIDNEEVSFSEVWDSLLKGNENGSFSGESESFPDHIKVHLTSLESFSSQVMSKISAISELKEQKQEILDDASITELDSLSSRLDSLSNKISNLQKKYEDLLSYYGEVKTLFSKREKVEKEYRSLCDSHEYDQAFSIIEEFGSYLQSLSLPDEFLSPYRSLIEEWSNRVSAEKEKHESLLSMLDSRIKEAENLYSNNDLSGALSVLKEALNLSQQNQVSDYIPVLEEKIKEIESTLEEQKEKEEKITKLVQEIEEKKDLFLSVHSEKDLDLMDSLLSELGKLIDQLNTLSYEKYEEYHPLLEEWVSLYKDVKREHEEYEEKKKILEDLCKSFDEEGSSFSYEKKVDVLSEILKLSEELSLQDIYDTYGSLLHKVQDEHLKFEREVAVLKENINALKNRSLNLVESEEYDDALEHLDELESLLQENKSLLEEDEFVSLLSFVSAEIERILSYKEGTLAKEREELNVQENVLDEEDVPAGDTESDSAGLYEDEEEGEEDKEDEKDEEDEDTTLSRDVILDEGFQESLEETLDDLLSQVKTLDDEGFSLLKQHNLMDSLSKYKKILSLLKGE